MIVLTEFTQKTNYDRKRQEKEKSDILNYYGWLVKKVKMSEELGGNCHL